MQSGAVRVRLLAVLARFAARRMEMAFDCFAAAAAILCFMGGPLRILFAALFEEGAPRRQYPMPSTYAQSSIPPPVRLATLPPANPTQTAPWRRPQTAEILQPPSVVTDHTTRLLEKSEPEES